MGKEVSEAVSELDFKIETGTFNRSLANLFVIVIDGFRWHEVFAGADPGLLNDKKFTPDDSARHLFSDEQRESRRKKLLPFFWNVVAARGQVFGDRTNNSKVNAVNPYSVSYPGYNELFCGKAGLQPAGNKKGYNRNINVLEYLNEKPSFRGNIAMFASWNRLPYVLNRKRNRIFMDCGLEEETTDKIILAKNVADRNDKNAGQPSPETRYDAITYEQAKKFIQQHHPRVAVIVFGEADVQAHQKRYDLYLKEANKTDGRIAELWNMIQEAPPYKNNTNLLITTDHGRGSSRNNWHDHRLFVRGSSQTWLGLLGPGINSLELDKQQVYNKEIAGMIARLVGEDFPY
ncbi:MAG TPA: alkaline phosphatase family protein [Chitinophagaceae bacterium]|nr:alkaline phosphatase family protein [Chitinophagaceae bacterium]